MNRNEADYFFDGDPAGRAAFEAFGIRYLYPYQRLVIANVLEAVQAAHHAGGADGADTEDGGAGGNQIVLLPTGAGKSLCFQVPALLLAGVTLVVYPLLALMADQLRRMKEGGIPCAVLRGGQTPEERRAEFQKIRDGAKIVLTNPETLCAPGIVEELKQLRIQHIAIDEAHCVSEWGDTFRPAYRELGRIVRALNAPAATAFTATASPEALQRIADILFEGGAHIVRSESDRPNIRYYVRNAAAKKQAVLYLAAHCLQSMIIFCRTRKRAEDTARDLNLCFGAETARFYHAGLEKAEKQSVEAWFFARKTGILCATCAYGMGVDKPDIRTVVHLDAPETPEAYIQEAGRGGRDGKAADAILLWNHEDDARFSRFPAESRHAAMHAFARTTDCRRQVLLDALGAENAYCSGCDLCNARRGIPDAPIYAPDDAERVYRLIARCKKRYTATTIEEPALKLLNAESALKLGRRIWNGDALSSIIQQLLAAGSIKTCTGLWRGRLSVGKKAPHINPNDHAASLCRTEARREGETCCILTR